MLQSDDELVITETYGVVDGALGQLDPIDRSLLTVVDIDGVPFSQAVMVLDRARRDARKRRAGARFAVRSTSTSTAELLRLRASIHPSRWIEV